VTAGNKEVLSGTDAVVISCLVTGLTRKLQAVLWKNSDGTDVKDLGDYTIAEGQFDGFDQITTVTVAKTQTTADADYKCLITPTAPDDTTVIITTVSLKVFSKFCVSVHYFRILEC
jgi:hypothetical protein